MLEIAEVENILNDKTIKIFETTFMKKDQTERHMFFTVDNDMIEQLGITYKATKKRAHNPEVVNVVELTRDGEIWKDAQYRSFRKDSVIILRKAAL